MAPDGVFEPIVDRLLFDAAQVIIRERSHRLSSDEMLDCLRRLFAVRGYLSGLMIDEADSLPSSSAYQSRFGSLSRCAFLLCRCHREKTAAQQARNALQRGHPYGQCQIWHRRLIPR